ncbi:hypothetical protein RI367_003898 [Sorochytrium milnesiophthora]
MFSSNAPAKALSRNPFITEAEAQEIRQNKEEQYRKFNNGKDPTPEELVDSRPLAERLAEQRRKKEDAFAEATRLSNLIHKLDEDEIEFLEHVHEAGTQADRDARNKELLELDAFRKRQEQLDLARQTQDKTETRVNMFSTTRMPVAAKSTALAGVVVGKNAKRPAQPPADKSNDSELSPRKRSKQEAIQKAGKPVTKTPAAPLVQYESSDGEEP